MQFKQQHSPLYCISHPNSIICSVQVTKKCPLKSRLACMKCMMENNTMTNFIELNDFLSIDSLIESMKKIQDCNLKVCQYLTKSIDNQLESMETFVRDMTIKFNALKSSLIEELKLNQEYQIKSIQLRHQFDAESINLQNKLQQVTQINDYHQSKEWVQLEKCIDQYVQLFYQPQNQEINVTLHALDAQIEKRQLPQKIEDFKASLEITLNQFVLRMQVNEASLSIFENSVFGLQLINRITDFRKKSMRLIFNAQKDGMNVATFWKHCENQGPTIMICESKLGQIFGGYTPCKWLITGSYHEDKSMSSFLFSFTKQQIYPLKVMQNAILGGFSYGPVFGAGNDLWIKSDFQQVSSKLGISYDTSKYAIVDDTTHLMGEKTPTLKNIELYIIE